MLQVLAAYSGLIAIAWIISGVFIVGRVYGNYSHSRQFLSELGAAGSPTEKLSPLINNYPLGILFCIFGWYITQRLGGSLSFWIAGALIAVHGVGTVIAGYFPMDIDAYTTQPSPRCLIHLFAGLVMQMSLLIASLLFVFGPLTSEINFPFKIFSISCFVLSILFTIALGMVFKRRTVPGLFQRLSYGVQLVWLGALCFVLAR